MPESHKKFGAGLYGYVSFTVIIYSSSYWACTNFNFILIPGLSTPPHHIKLFMTMMKMHKR